MRLILLATAIITTWSCNLHEHALSSLLTSTDNQQPPSGDQYTLIQINNESVGRWGTWGVFVLKIQYVGWYTVKMSESQTQISGQDKLMHWFSGWKSLNIGQYKAFLFCKGKLLNIHILT